MFNKLLVTFFGIGNIKFAPGTIASFISLILLLILNYYITKPTFILIFIFLLIISFLFVKEYILELKTKDSQEIVIDEVLGIYLILILIKIDYEMVIPSFIMHRLGSEERKHASRASRGVLHTANLTHCVRQNAP